MTHPVTLQAEIGLLSDLLPVFAESTWHRIGFDVDDRAIGHLAEAFPTRHFRSRRKREGDRLAWTHLLLRFACDCFVLVRASGYNDIEIHAATSEQAMAAHDEVRAALGRLPSLQQEAHFYVLRYDEGLFLTESVTDLPPDPGDEFITLGYGTDALDWMQQFQERTTAKVGGITLLDGPPGTGKTSFISLLIRRLRETHVFYSLPVARDDAFTSPELIPFWKSQNERHPDRVKVVVLEDAERLLWSSRQDTREAVSALLNIADGLIGRMLRLHLIFSMNARAEGIDPALLRPGRLRTQRHFPLLHRGTAERIASIRGLSLDPSDERERLPLADVLNPGTPVVPPKKRLGF